MSANVKRGVPAFTGADMFPNRGSEVFSGEAVYEAIKTGRRLQPRSEAAGWDAGFVLNKMAEEFGEFVEASLIKDGKLPEKEQYHDYAPFEEGADVVLCVLDELVRLYPEMGPDQIYVMFKAWIDRKVVKWEKVLDDRSNAGTE